VPDVADNGRVTQLGEDASLAEKPLRPTSGQDLDGDRFATLSIKSPIDRAHAAGACEALDLEAVGEHLPCTHRGGKYLALGFASSTVDSPENVLEDPDGTVHFM
jgi:hypothetical protein